MMNCRTIVPFALILEVRAFFFTENATDYNKLADLDILLLQPTPPVANKITTQPSPTSSPVIVTTTTIVPPESSVELVPTNASFDNSTLSKNETKQEESPKTTKTRVDPSAAIYEKAFIIAPRVTGPLSMVGSILIAMEVLRKEGRNRNTYHRLLLAMSIVDINTSFWYSLSSLPIPKATNHNHPEFCNAQAWAIQMGVATPIYNTTLAAFYLLVIRYKWENDKLKMVEYLFHGLPLCFAIGTSLAGLGSNIYGNADVWCWIKGDEHVYRLAFFYGPFFTTILVAILLTLSTVHYVYSVEKHANKVFSKAQRKGSKDPALSNSMNSFRVGTNSNSYTKRVATQSFCYIAAYFVTWTPLVIVRIIQFAGAAVPKWLLLLGAFFTPFQGFFNCLVYFRQHRKKCKRYNCCKLLSEFSQLKITHTREPAFDRTSNENYDVGV